MNNENNAHIALIKIGSPAVDVTVPGIMLPQRSVIKSVKVMNGAAIAANASNYAVIQLLAGATVVAQYDTRPSGLTALAAGDMAVVAGQEKQIAGTVLSVKYDETDAGSNVALTDAVVQVEYYPL